MVRAAPLVLVKVTVCMELVLITCLSSSMNVCARVSAGETNVVMTPVLLFTVRIWLFIRSPTNRFPVVGEIATPHTLVNVALVAGPPSPHIDPAQKHFPRRR